MTKRSLTATMKLLFLLLAFCQTLSAQQLDHVLGQCLIQLKDLCNSESLLEELSAQQPSGKFQLQQLSIAPVNLWTLNFDHNSINEIHLLESLRKNQWIQLAQFNHFVSDRSIPNDTQFDSQWQYINTGQSGGTPDADLDAEYAWSVSTGGVTTDGDTIVVCIIDEGIDPDHEDLQGSFWKNYMEIPNNGIDDDNNGYIDDYNGWNVVTMNDNLTNGNNPGWHGTPVAGIIGAKGNNNLGVTGVNWNVKVMVVVRGITEAQTIAAYSYPYLQRKKYNETNGLEGAFVVATNTSWGVDFGQPEDAPLWCAFYDSLGMVGILDAAATINGNFNVDQVGDLPTTCPSDFLVSVTNVNHADYKNTNAGYGTEHIDLGAYGTNVWTLKKNNSYGAFSGTSAAAPHVAGAIALLYSAPCPDISWFAKNAPDATALLMKNYLMDGVTQNSNLSNLVKSGGHLNLYNSIQMLMNNCAFTACFPPSLISTNNINLDNATIDWLSNSNINSVILRYRQIGASQWINVNNISAPFTIIDLVPCTNYEYSLQSICDSGQSPISPIHNFKTDGCCEAPGPLQIVNLTTNSASISWPDQSVAENYHIRYRIPAEPWSEFNSGITEVILVGLEPCTSYEVQVSTLCQNGTSTAYSPILNFETMGCSYCLESTYCSVAGPATALSWISLVNINDLENSSGNSNGGYSDFTDLSASLIQGYYHDIHIETDNDFVQIPLYVQLWIDFNQDGWFSGVDLAFQSNTAISAVNGSINIPPNAFLGDTRMRIVGSPEIMNPCDTLLSAGEVEDYCVSILAPTECLAPVGYSLQAGINNITLSWTGSLITDSYAVRYREIGNPDWIYIFTALHFLTIQSLTPCSDYELQVQGECSGENSAYSPLQYFTTLGCGVCLDMDYCEPIPGSSIFEWIAHFQLNEIDHYSEGEGYGNFAGASTDLLLGEAYDFLIEPGFAGDIYEEHYSIWIDYNQDGTFSDLSEKVFDSGDATTDNMIIGQITIPNFALQGSTRLRISMKYLNPAEDACEGGFDGEIQDYCINIYSSPTQLCSPPNPNLDDVSETTANISWTGPPSTISYQFRFKEYGNPNIDWQVITSPNEFYFFNDLMPCQAYEYQVRTICDTGLSQYSAIEYFETDCGSSATSDINELGVLVYPNPFSDQINIQWNNEPIQSIDLKIYNSMGEVIKSQKYLTPENEKVELSLKDSPSGIYFIELKEGIGSKLFKVIKL